MSKIVVVTGVTGVQGTSVTDTFLKLPDWKVRGITRNPSSEVAQALAARGVEIVQGDFDDEASLHSAFKGATAIFANTDFFVHLIQALSPGVTPAGKNANEYAYDREVEQGINIAEAAASPEVLKTLKHFIFSSLTDARKWSGGKYTSVWHFDSKAEVIRIIQTRFPELAARMSTLQVGHYVTNWKSVPSMAPLKQPDGSYLMIRTFSAKCQLPFVVTARDTGAFVKALVDVPPGKDLLGVSETMTCPEWISTWGRVMGVKTSFRQVSGDELFENVPGPLKEELVDAFDFVEEFGYTGGDSNVLLPSQLGVHIPLTSMEEYFKSEDWSSVLST